MKEPIYIMSSGSLSALGSEPKEIRSNYRSKEHFLQQHKFGNYTSWVGKISTDDREAVEKLRTSSSLYKPLDSTVLYAMKASRQALEKAGWDKEASYGINVGSSRGATGLFEDYHREFLETGKAATLASPTTTLGNIASWVAQDRITDGPVISHSITCSTALHALLNSAAWMLSGMADKFLVGGSEAALTPFTIAQMKALKILTSEGQPYPCRSLDMEKKRNSMVLGEGAAMICLEKHPVKQPLARIAGLGMATEKLSHNASISSDARCFQESMKMALGNMDPKSVDAIIAHAPGTVKGDQAEVNAVNKVFGKNSPAITANKWKIGHTFGASGLFSLELALEMIRDQEFMGIPFINYKNQPDQINNILVNAVGFGGNAVSVLVSRPG